MPESGPGRPEYKPTDEHRNFVKCLTAAGIVQESIADVLDIDRKTLAKHFARELKSGRDEVIGLAVTNLVELIKEKNLGAICFYLKSRAGWKETQVVEQVMVKRLIGVPEDEI